MVIGKGVKENGALRSCEAFLAHDVHDMLQRSVLVYVESLDLYLVSLPFSRRMVLRM
jgi:hypothetical protein